MANEMYSALEDQNTEIHLEKIFCCDLPPFLGHWVEDVMPEIVATTLYQ